MSISYDFPKLIRESGFSFETERPRKALNWNDIRVIDINKLIRDRDFAVLDSHIEDVLNCQLETEFNVNILDDGFVKIFRLGQLSIQYLLQCRKYMDLIAIAMKSEVREMSEEILFLKKQLHDKEREIRILETKLRKKNKYNKDFKHGNMINILKQLNINSNDFFGENKCVHCNKFFLNHFYLRSHITRRHPENMNFLEEKSPANESPIKSKLDLEIKEIKERLNAAEKLYQSNEINEKIPITYSNSAKEDIESNEKDDNNKDSNADNTASNEILEILQKWRLEENEISNVQIENLKANLFENINSIKDKLESIEKIKHLDNDDKLDKISNEIHSQANELKVLKEDVLQKTSNHLNELENYMELQEKKLENKLRVIEAEQKEHINVLDELKSNVMLYINKTQNMSTYYQNKIIELENKALEQKEASLQHNKIILQAKNEPVEGKSEISVQTNSDQNYIENSVRKFSQSEETLPAYDSSISSSSRNSQDIVLEEKFDIDPIRRVDTQMISNKNSLGNEKRKHHLNDYRKKSDDVSKYKNQNDSKTIKHPKEAKIYKTKKKLRNLQRSPTSEKNKKSDRENTKQSENHGKIKVINENVENSSIEDRLSHLLSKRPSIIEALKDDLSLILNKRLQHMGIAETQKNISNENFNICYENIQAKRKTLIKQYKGYNKIKNNIIKTLEQKLNKADIKKDYENSTKKPPKITNSLGKIETLINSVKKKAKMINKSRENSLFQAKSEIILNKTDKSEQEKSNINKLSAKSLLDMIEKNSYEPSIIHRPINKNDKKQSSSSANSINDDSSDESGEIKSQVVHDVLLHDSKESIEDILSSPVRKPDYSNSETIKVNSSPSRKIEKVNIEQHIKVDDQNTHGRFSKSISKSMSDIDDETSSINSIIMNEIFSNGNLERKVRSEENVSGTLLSVSPKSVLKNVSSSSSLTKKKVNFDLDMNKMKSYGEDISNSSSIESSEQLLSDLSKLSSKKQQEINENEQIENNKLKPIRGPKIAEIAASIETQLNSRNTKPLFGSVDTLFQSNSSQQRNAKKPDIPVISNHNLTQIKPKTTKTNNTNSDIELSDWSIEDLINDK